MKIRFQRSEKDPNAIHGVKIPYATAKRRSAQWRWYLILLVVSSPLLYFLIKMLLSVIIVTAPGYVALERLAVNSTTAGLVDAIAVEVGQDVAAGTVIARLHSPDLDTQQQMLEAEQSTLKRPDPHREAARALLLRDRMELAREVLASEDKYHQTLTFLFDQGAATLAELNVAVARKNKAQIEYDLARYEQRLYDENTGRLAAAPDPGLERQRERIGAQLKALAERRGRLSQVLSYGGRILDIFISPGEVLSPGAPILLLGRSNKPFVRAYLSPKYAKYARQGRSAQVKLPDGRTLQALVDEDAQMTQRLPAHLTSPIGSRDLMLMVRLTFSAPLPPIQWVDGLPVTVRFSF